MLDDCLNQWHQANLGTLPRAPAIDGQWIRDRTGSRCLSPAVGTGFHNPEFSHGE